MRSVHKNVTAILLTAMVNYIEVVSVYVSVNVIVYMRLVPNHITETFKHHLFVLTNQFTIGDQIQHSIVL